MTTVGINGGITGKGGDLIIIDDPVKTWKEAMSPTYQDSTRDWFDSVLYTRAEPGASFILLQTRWHKKDLAGYLLTEHEDDWKEINFPAIATGKDDLGRHKGDPLCPQRYDIRKLQKIKAVLPPRMWNALYQGTPSDDEGNILKRTYWKTWTVLPTFLDEWILSVDMNMKEGINNDFTVIQCWARKGAMYYLVDQVKGQWGITHQIEAFKRMCVKWPEARKRLVENKANGPALQGLLKRAISGIVLVEPDGGKEVRAMAAEPALQSGNVHVPADVGSNPWVPDFIEECGTFPTAEHDDQVDAATQAINYFESKSSSDINKLLIM
jgi:predicted phage terminase large subunit-like protein